MTTVTIKEWLEDKKTDSNPIICALAEWTLDSLPGNELTIKNVVQHLETTDCAACHAPNGLIYNHDIAAKIPEWFVAIDDAFYDYEQETGENPKPRDGSLSIGWLVWFAVEWNAHNLASLIESNSEDGTVTETIRYCAGWNMPGFMPEEPPEEFNDLEDATRYIMESIERQCEEDDLPFDAENMLDTLKKDDNLRVGKFNYFISTL